MCGILAVLRVSEKSQLNCSRIEGLSETLQHRGPYRSDVYQHQDNYLANQSAIVGPVSGDQPPLFNQDKEVLVTFDGKFYNHDFLRSIVDSDALKTGSDCELIARVYEEYGEEIAGLLDGAYSFVLLDTRDNSFIAVRDPVGLTPLYVGWGADGSIWFSSEMKALKDDCESFYPFPPGHIYSSKTHFHRQYYDDPAWSYSEVSTPYDPIVLRQAFEKAVVKRLPANEPFGVLLSGGVDSSLIASVASRHMAALNAERPWESQLHTFCIGLEDSSDMIAAKEVATYIGSLHHEIYFTVEDGIRSLEDVINYVETYDVTTIRSSIPMFLMSQKIKSLGVKTVLSGDGSDEIFGGYLYFHKAPNKEEFYKETRRKLNDIHLYDCLRVNKSTSACGVEARAPFLDPEFIDVVMDIDPEWKMIKPGDQNIEKWILRNAFDDEEKPYLPKRILYRPKEQFSDGVGYSWIDGLKNHAEKQVTDAELNNASVLYPGNTPTTKEGYLYRTIFGQFFPKKAARFNVPKALRTACSSVDAARWNADWSKNRDTSGRMAIGVHQGSYEPAIAIAVNGPPFKKLKV